MRKNVVDSSGWLEYFADASNARFFASLLGYLLEVCALRASQPSQMVT